MASVTFEMPWLRAELVTPPYLFRRYEPLVELLLRHKARILEHVQIMAGYRDDLLRITTGEPPLRGRTTEQEPSFEPGLFGHWDACALYAMVRHYRPSRVLEVGSGISTRFISRAMRDGGFRSTVISTDPAPRAEIDSISDVVVRRYYEDVFSSLPALSPGDILFYDGSHFVLPHSDLVVLVLEVVPRLPKGAIIHFHDIFIPEDLPPREEWREKNWMETYLVGTMLLFGEARFEVLLANRALCSMPELAQPASELLSFPADTLIMQGGGSLWLRTV